MLCEDVLPELPAFLDGELSSEDREAISAHLAGCAGCQAERASIERMIARVRALPRTAAPLSLAAAVAARLPSTTSAVSENRGERPLTCGALEAADLSAFLDGELPEEARDRTREHIAACAICAETLVWLDDVSGRVRVLPRVSAPANLLAIVLARIEDLLAQARGVVVPAAIPVVPAAAPAAPAPRRPWSRVPRPTGAPRSAEPIRIPESVQRFLAAASVLVLALGGLAFATPHAGPMDWGTAAKVYTVMDVAKLEKPPEPPRLPQVDAERVVGVACDDPAQAATSLVACAASANVKVFETNQPHTLGVTGSVQDLRPLFKRLSVEDGARVEILVPQALDQVYTRNGEVLQGIVERQDQGAVVLATTVRGTPVSGQDQIPTPAVRGTGLAASYWEIPLEAGDPGDVLSAVRSVEGRAAFVRTDATVDYATPGGGPGALAFNLPFPQLERIVVHWHGYFNAERAGRHAFTVGSDDGALLEIDGTPVVNADGRHGYAEYGGQVDLTKGLHAIDLRFFNGGGPGACRLIFTPPGGRTSVVPQGLLYDPDRIEAGRRALTLVIPRRSVVRVKPASHDPVTVYVLLRRRSD